MNLVYIHDDIDIPENMTKMDSFIRKTHSHTIH